MLSANSLLLPFLLFTSLSQAIPQSPPFTIPAPISPPFNLDVCRGTPQPTPLGPPIAYLNIYRDTSCRQFLTCETIYQNTVPRCRALLGLSIKPTFLKYTPPSIPGAPASGYVLATWMDRFCEAKNGPAFGFDANTQRHFNPGDCVDATKFPTYKVVSFPGEV